MLIKTLIPIKLKFNKDGNIKCHQVPFKKLLELNAKGV